MSRLVCSSSSAFSSAPNSTANALRNSQNISTMTPKKDQREERTLAQVLVKLDAAAFAEA
jgi:hypothetical protein